MILIPKIEGESIPARRRRLARIICDRIVYDELLKQEIAMLFSLNPDDLDYNVPSVDEPEIEIPIQPDSLSNYEQA